MKNFKKLSLLLVVLILVFSVAACTTDTKKPDKDIIEPPGNITENPMDEPIDQPIDEPIDEPIKGDIGSRDAIIGPSDYISKIEVISIGQDKTEIKVLDNIKKDLDPAKLPVIPELEEGKTYLVFMKDEGDTVVLTDEREGFVPLEGDNMDLFERINKQVNNL